MYRYNHLRILTRRRLKFPTSPPNLNQQMQFVPDLVVEMRRSFILRLHIGVLCSCSVNAVPRFCVAAQTPTIFFSPRSLPDMSFPCVAFANVPPVNSAWFLGFSLDGCRRINGSFDLVVYR